MAEAGLTNGAFYPHFESKDVLVREALSDAMSHRHTELKRESETGSGIEGAIRGYLNKSHLVGSEEGCPSAALLPEISRQPEQTRKAYEERLLAYVTTLAEHLSHVGSVPPDRRAMGIFSLMVGTLQIARAVTDESLAEDILEGGVEAALMLAQETTRPVATKSATPAQSGDGV